jgi:hypothetical protein
MSYLRQKLVLVSDASGNAEGYFQRPPNGIVSMFQYAKTDYDNGVAVSMVGEYSGDVLWVNAALNANKVVHPMTLQQLNSTGADVAGVYAKPVVAGERVKVTVSSGGNVKTGTFFMLAEVGP